jgi:hypothetical protein
MKTIEEPKELAAQPGGLPAASGYADRAASSVARTMMVLRVLRRRCHRKGEEQQARVFERLMGTLYAAEFSLTQMQKHTKN